MSEIYDNITNRFSDALRGIISNVGVKRTDFCVGYFNLRGWGCIGDLINELPGDDLFETIDGRESEVHRTCRVLVGMQRPSEDFLRAMYAIDKSSVFEIDSDIVKKEKRKAAEDFRKQLITGVPTSQDEKTLQMLKQQLKEGKVAVKLYLKNPLHAKLYLAYRPDDNFNKIQALLGSSNLTFSGLVGQGELDTDISDSTNAEKLKNWFEDKWNEKYCIDITEMLIQVLDESWASGNQIPPYYIYLKTAYHLSQEARNGMNEYELPLEFKNELFGFQETAVKLAARHLEKRGGAMIGDVVGLGKTITACAVAKVYEMKNACSTLILCPANLQDMWVSYVKKYDLKADVQSIQKKIDYRASRYYKLVIIDESHNLRNPSGQRYKNIKELIDFQNCKVLLLTATPYNKQYTDLSSQLRLFVHEDDDLGITPENYIKSLGGQTEFSVKHSEDFIRSIKAFEHSYDTDDWRSLMRLFLVRRTRSFIKNNYAKDDKTNNRKYLEFKDGTRSYFPNRIPKSVKFKITNGDQYERLYSTKMLDLFSSLTLPRYGLILYLDKEKARSATEKEKLVIQNLTQAGNSMIGFCRTTFMKRLDSSGMSFLISVYRHILRNAVYLYAIKNSLPLPIGDDGNIPDDYLEDQDFEDNFSPTNPDASEQNPAHTSFPLHLETYMESAKNYYQVMERTPQRFSWISSTYFKPLLKRKLEVDCEMLIHMLGLCGTWEAENDQKITELETLLTKTHKDDKCLIFTQFSDTANYITKELKRRGIEKIVCVTGNTENISRYTERFSPNSNKAEVSKDDELRILVATDVLSEGQNLQDSHVVINFDLPWAIIRLIQRAGRVDRIGQESDKIFCYSFFPADGIENIINLRKRLNQRINENAQVVGNDEIFFEGNEQNLADLYNEKSGVLDEEDESSGEVDLASEAYQIWKNAIEKNPELKEKIPVLNNVIYSTKENKSKEKKQGVITYARTQDGNDMLSWIDENGSIVTQSQKVILDALACDENEPALETIPNHHELVKKSLEAMNTVQFRTSGILGSRFSTKYQVYTKLDGYCKAHGADLFTTRLKPALDDIYNYPLKESAKTLLGSAVRKQVSVEQLIELVTDLHSDDELVIKQEDDNINKDAQIICSMGMR